MYWMIAANGTMYDHAEAFQRWGFIDWRQKVKYTIGDVVYIYCTKPLKRVMFKTIVEKESMKFNEIVDDTEYWHVKEEHDKAIHGDYARLRLIAQVNSENLTLSKLKEQGLKAAPQGPIKLKEDLAKYIDTYMNDYMNEHDFPESDVPKNCYEGNVCQVLVNKFERSSIARQKCIEYHGTKCFVCGFDFEKVYGEIGKGFIHVHHIIPLNEIGKEYIVDYKNDLIPVCPNCHAMLHRKIDGKYYSWKELRKVLIYKIDMAEKFK